MMLNNNIINNKEVNVKTSIKDFEDFIASECLEIEEKKEDKEITDFFKLIPKIHLPFVLWKIEKQFNNDKKAFIRKHKLFLKIFDLEKKRLCDNSYIMDRETKRKLRKTIKYEILHSAQLLGLIGKNGKSYVTDNMLDLYKEDIENQEAYLTNFRLITKKGKFLKLQTIEAKQRKRNAQILNLSSCLAQMSKDKGFTWCMITYTLPPSYHPNPTKGQNSYSGVSPQEAHKVINGYWRKTRALLAKAGLKAGLDYFGCSVFEVMKDSTLHKHALIYIDESNIDLLKNAVYGVASRSKEYVKFDIVENGTKKIKDKKTGKITYLQVPKVEGATYIYKYIMKFNGTYTDDNTLKNQSARYFYSARGFDFFGLKSSLTKFDYLIANYKKYKELFCDELNRIFETFNYYEFQKNYEKYFTIVRNHKNVILFIEYDLNGNNDIDFRLNNYVSNLTNQRVIIRKKLYSVFEITEEIRDKEIKSINEIDINDLKNSGIKSALDLVNQMELDYSNFINDYKSKNTQFQYISKKEQMNNDYLISSLMGGMKPHDEEGNQIETNFNVLLVTLKESDSRKSRKRSATHIEILDKYFHLPNKAYI